MDRELRRVRGLGKTISATGLQHDLHPARPRPPRARAGAAWLDSPPGQGEYTIALLDVVVAVSRSPAPAPAAVRGELVAPADELVDAFALTHVASVQTQRTYERACRRFVHWLGPLAGPEDLTAAAVARYHAHLVAGGRSSATVKKDRAALNSFLRWLAAHDKVPAAQAREALAVRLPRAQRADRETPKALDEAQYERLLREAKARITDSQAVLAEILRTLGALAEFPDDLRHPHALRHTCATHLLSTARTSPTSADSSDTPPSRRHRSTSPPTTPAKKRSSPAARAAAQPSPPAAKPPPDQGGAASLPLPRRTAACSDVRLSSCEHEPPARRRRPYWLPGLPPRESAARQPVRVRLAPGGSPASAMSRRTWVAAPA